MSPLDDKEALQVLSTLIKQRRDSIEQFTKGGRQELADKEAEEIKNTFGKKAEILVAGNLPRKIIVKNNLIQDLLRYSGLKNRDFIWNYGFPVGW